MREPYDIVILGLALSSAWGNGHATTFRALIKGLKRRGRRVLFLEREQPWYAANREFTRYPHCALEFYEDFETLTTRHAADIRDARAVIVGSFVPDGVKVARWVLDTAHGVRAFYDIDTPVTLDAVTRGTCAYLTRDLIARFDLYLSFTGGPTLTRLKSEFGARNAQPLYCSVDLDQHRPMRPGSRSALGYLGTFSTDRQPRLEELLLAPARRLRFENFHVVGAQYPPDIRWPPNVRREAHLPPVEHARFFSSQRFTLNLTRDSMIEAGYSPSVRLFEAAACATPVISDEWDGLDSFFEPGKEILLASSAQQVCDYLARIDARGARAMGDAARVRVLAQHTGVKRAAELENYLGLPMVRRHRQARAAATGTA